MTELGAFCGTIWILLRSIALAAFFAAAACGHSEAGECNRFAIAVATDPVPYQYPAGLEKSAMLLQHAPAEADVVLIGDSLAANWPADMARRQFGTDKVWNFAVGGSVTQNTLWQIGKLQIGQMRPSTVVVVIGTNNLTREDMPACAVAAGIEAVVAAAHRKWPAAQIDVMGIPPRGTDFRFRNDARLAVNAELRDWAGTLPYLRYFEPDASKITCGLYDAKLHVASAKARQQPACANYADDFGHFRRPGYDVIFSALRQAHR
jgi:lysophospholipase L1-like esterase